jgi:hypothetical protein
LLSQVSCGQTLPSISSAAGRLALFGDFIATAGLSDFPGPFIVFAERSLVSSRLMKK